MNLLDFKGQMERKFMSLSEEMPQRIKQEIKSFELKEQALVKDVSLKF